MQISNVMDDKQNNSKVQIEIQNVLMRCRIHSHRKPPCMAHRASHALQVDRTFKSDEVGEQTRRRELCRISICLLSTEIKLLMPCILLLTTLHWFFTLG